MDKKLIELANYVQKTDERIQITIATDGLLLHGQLVSPKIFARETEGVHQAVNDVASAKLAKQFLANAQADTSEGILHLFEVFIVPGSNFFASGSGVYQVMFPSMRIDAARVTGWSFGVPLTSKLAGPNELKGAKSKSRLKPN